MRPLALDEKLVIPRDNGYHREPGSDRTWAFVLSDGRALFRSDCHSP